MTADSKPDNAIEYDELYEFMDENDYCQRILGKYEPEKPFKEKDNVFKHFRRFGIAKFAKIEKNVIKVIHGHQTFHNTPEELYTKLLAISDQTIPYIENKRSLSQSLVKLVKSPQVVRSSRFDN